MNLTAEEKDEVDIELLAQCCLSETNPDLVIFNSSLAVGDCDCLQEKLSLATALNISDENLSVCNEEFPPLYRWEEERLFVQFYAFNASILLILFLFSKFILISIKRNNYV